MAAKKKTAKPAASKPDAGKEIKIRQYLKVLADPATERHEKCRVRGHLRRLGHYGGLRNRTYVDKSTGETIVVEKKEKKVKTA
jgi:hypothetical protein